MSDPPDVVNILFTGVAPTRQDGQSKGAHFYCDRRLATLARGASLVGSGAAGLMLSGNSCENLKLETCNLKRLDKIRFEMNLFSRRTGFFSLLFQIDRIR